MNEKNQKTMQSLVEVRSYFFQNKKNRYIFICIFLLAFFAVMNIISRFNYTLFHSFADMITVFIAASVFVIIWNGRHLLDNHYYICVSIGFLFFAFFDFMHLLGNKGMSVFPQFGNMGPEFYIISRYFLSISFLLAPFFIRRKIWTSVMITVYSVISILILLSIFYWKNFPIFYIDGVGLTPLKIISDYVIDLFFLGAIGLLLFHRRAFDAKVLRFILLSLVLSIGTGLAFILYTDPFGIMNEVGHFLQMASFYLIYVTFVETGLVKPQNLLFRNLTQSNEERATELASTLYLSYHDQLTGLYNRRFYTEELEKLDSKENLPITIVMGDVNGLKLINDSFGHAMGDELLKKVAEVIKMGCRTEDIIARLGGDEFVIILPKTAAFETEQIIERIKDLSLREKVGNIDISISFGYATKSNKEENIQEIFTHAEDLMYWHKRSESSVNRNKTIDLVMNTLYTRSNREQLHSIKVSKICEAIATKMDFSENDVHQIKIAGLMHDIGKIEIDENILNKPEKLRKDEWEKMQRHPEVGYRILSSVNEFSVIADDILEHHERWDGKGYPRGLKGEESSLYARIIAVADSYDAMTSDRAYGKAMSEEVAINEIRRCSGTQFDPTIVKIFIEQVVGIQ